MSAALNGHSQAYSEPPNALSHRVDDRCWRNMIQIPRRRRDGLMAQLLRDDADVHAFGAELGGVRVPEAVGLDSLLDAGLARQSGQ